MIKTVLKPIANAVKRQLRRVHVLTPWVLKDLLSHHAIVIGANGTGKTLLGVAMYEHVRAQPVRWHDATKGLGAQATRVRDRGRTLSSPAVRWWEQAEHDGLERLHVTLPGGQRLVVRFSAAEDMLRGADGGEQYRNLRHWFRGRRATVCVAAFNPFTVDEDLAYRAILGFVSSYQRRFPGVALQDALYEACARLFDLDRDAVDGLCPVEILAEEDGPRRSITFVDEDHRVHFDRESRCFHVVHGADAGNEPLVLDLVRALARQAVDAHAATVGQLSSLVASLDRSLVVFTRADLLPSIDGLEASDLKDLFPLIDRNPRRLANDRLLVGLFTPYGKTMSDFVRHADGRTQYIPRVSSTGAAPIFDRLLALVQRQRHWLRLRQAGWSVATACGVALLVLVLLNNDLPSTEAAPSAETPAAGQTPASPEATAATAEAGKEKSKS
ncbi:MAG: hypothetical protein KDK91_10490 [Gammaproteobacteria bacterium]|nr:hypothetical protein [Gammaproteobacteria bacterium]